MRRITRLAVFALVTLAYMSNGLGDEWQFSVANPVSSSTVFTVEPPEPVKPEKKPKPAYHIVYFYADWCGVCRSPANLNNIDDMRKAGFRVRGIDLSDGISDTIWANQISVYPSFWLMKDEDNEWGGAYIEKWNGTVTATTVTNRLNRYKSPKKTSPTKASQSSPRKSGFFNPSIFNGRRGNSHQNRQSLINHLLNDGIHRGRYTLNQLTNSSDDELNRLHNRDHR
jgi:thiol-disulfide isomerase/thioredoxin